MKFNKLRGGLERTLLYTDKSGGQLWQGNRHDVANVDKIHYSTVILAAYDFQPRILTPEQAKSAPDLNPFEVDDYGDSNQDIITSCPPNQIIRIPIIEPDLEEASYYLHMLRSPTYAVAYQACAEIKGGKQVLSSCWAGLNRSSFISATILWILKQGSMDGLIDRLTEERCFGCEGLKVILRECEEHWAASEDYLKKKREKKS